MLIMAALTDKGVREVFGCGSSLLREVIIVSISLKVDGLFNEALGFPWLGAGILINRVGDG